MTLAFLAVSAVMPLTSPAHAADAIDLFDAAVARGLPQTVTLPEAAGRGRHADPTVDGTLVIESSLDVEVRFPGDIDGDVPGHMYLATWQGDQAVLTRSGSHLDISVPRADNMEVTGFDHDTEAGPQPAPDAPHGGEAPETRRASRDRRAVPPRDTERATARQRHRASTPPVLTFWLFLHDDTLDMTREHIHAKYVAWWIADMKRILPTRRLWAIYSQQIDGLTDIAYGQASSLKDWTAAVDNYARREKLPYVRGEFEYKFLLLTSNEVAPGTSGLAWLGGDHAMASLKGRYTIVAHEYGHTLTAEHADAEVRWSSGWPCETNLQSTVNRLRANCYRYSAANERRMRSYMANEWTVPVRPDPPDTPRHMVE